MACCLERAAWCVLHAARRTAWCVLQGSALPVCVSAGSGSRRVPCMACSAYCTSRGGTPPVARATLRAGSVVCCTCVVTCCVPRDATHRCDAANTVGRTRVFDGERLEGCALRRKLNQRGVGHRSAAAQVDLAQLHARGTRVLIVPAPSGTLPLVLEYLLTRVLIVPAPSGGHCSAARRMSCVARCMLLHASTAHRVLVVLGAEDPALTNSHHDGALPPARTCGQPSASCKTPSAVISAQPLTSTSASRPSAAKDATCSMQHAACNMHHPEPHGIGPKCNVQRALHTH
jgi:hypothetical protein